MSNKTYISIAALLIAGIAVSLWYSSEPNVTISYGTSNPATTTTFEETSSHEYEDVPQPGTASVQPRTSIEVPVPAPRTSAPACSSTVRIIIESAIYVPCIANGTSLLAAMQAATADGLVFTGKEYPSLGFFIESINGKRGENGYYWFLYINGESSSAGASQTLVSAGDDVEWRYKQSY